jgi:nucleotide-binding universal stress UspA family protein
MFAKIAVAYNESPEAARALATAIRLAKTLGSELRAITVKQDPPAYASYASAVDSSLTRTLDEDQQGHYEKLHAEAKESASRDGVDLVTHLLDGEECEAIAQFLRHYRTDLLVIGLHRHTSHISRLWSTVYEVAQDAPCSVLGVH